MFFGRTFKKFSTRVALGALLVTSTAAGATGCSLFNTKVVWAITEPTPMQVVVRRADAARAVATNVERLMGSTGIDDDSKWVVKIALKKADVEPLLRDVSGDPEYVSPKGKVRVVNAEAWARALSAVCSTESKSKSVYGSVSDDVHTQYADIAAQAKNVAKIKADIAVEEAAIDDKERAGEKADHEAKKKELKDQLDKSESEYKPKVDAFKAKLKEDAAKASPEVKKQMAAVIAGLQRAVDDAKVANTAALIGYPKAFPGLKEEVKTIVKRIAADVIEERVGTRPNLDKLTPEVKLSGGVSVTIAGLGPEDAGKIDPAALSKDIAERSKNYIIKVVTLIGYIKETQDLLDLQTDLLAEAQGAISGDKNAGGGEDLADIKVELEAAQAANAGGGATGNGKGKRMAVPMEACVEKKEAPKAKEEEKPAEPAKADPPPEDPKGKGKGKGKKPVPQPPKKKGAN